MPHVEEAIVRLGSRLSYGEAEEELERMWRVKVPKSTLRKITLRNGQVADQLIKEQIAQLHQGEGEESSDAVVDQLVVSADGAMICTTTEGWKEVKTVAFGKYEMMWDAKKHEVRTQTDDISYFSRFEPATQFGESAVYEWVRRKGDRAKKVVAVNDGALWIQSFVDYHCPKAIRVIDFAHAKGYVAEIGRLIHGAETEVFRNWYQKMSKQLGKSPPQRTLADLRFLQNSHLDHPDQAEIAQAIGYLERRKEMIDYPHFRKEGIPIGSGMVESGHRVVMHRRMKQAGMRWKTDNINPMLALRMALCNQRWDETWQKIQTLSRQRRSTSKKAESFEEIDSRVVSEKDIVNLEKLAKKIDSKRQTQPWKDHRSIFPHRYH